jgi:hypothetical protein
MNEPQLMDTLRWAYGEIARLTAELQTWKDAALAAAAGIVERDAELQEVLKDAARWQNIRWHWEGERDMGRGGRWWTALWCNDKPATAEEAFDARINREATNGRPE